MLKHGERGKPIDCELVVFGLCEDYAKGLSPIPFHSSRVTIFISAGSVRTQHNWMRVKDLFMRVHLKCFRMHLEIFTVQMECVSHYTYTTHGCEDGSILLLYLFV